MYPTPSGVSTSASVERALRTMPVSLAEATGDFAPSLTSSVWNGSRRPLASYFGISGPTRSGTAGPAGGFIAAGGGAGAAGCGAPATGGFGARGGGVAGPPQAASRVASPIDMTNVRRALMPVPSLLRARLGRAARPGLIGWERQLGR